MPTASDLANYAQNSASQLGIRKFDVYGATVDETSVQVDHGEPKQVKASNRSSVMVRVWNQDNAVGVTSTTDTDPDGIQLALKTAHEASFFGVKQHAPDFSPAALAPLSEADVSTREPVSEKVAAPVPQLMETLIQAERDLLAAHPAIQGVPYNGIAQRDIERFYLNSEGARRHEANAYTAIYLYSRTEQDGKRPRSAGAYKLAHSLAQLDVSGCIQEAAEKTISHLDYQKINSGQRRVVFSAEAFLSLLGAFSNLFNAQSILDKQSLSTPESLGSQIASPLLSVVDQAQHPDNVTAIQFDGEGTPTQQVPLITAGVLTRFLHSAGTAKRFNTQPTGHASIGAKVTVSPNFYHVFQGAQSEQAYCLDTAENVILIDDLHALHAGVKALQGSFSLPFDGWLVNRGQRTSIEAATVAGDFRELLRSIVSVESEPEVTPAGVCPRIWVDKLSVTAGE